MTPEQLATLISSAFGGGILGKMIDKAFAAVKESRALREKHEDDFDRAMRSRNMLREELAKARVIAVELGAKLDPLPPDPYDDKS